MAQVDEVGVHVLVVAGRVVAHRIGDDRRMVLGRPHEDLGVLRVAVRAIGVGGLPVVLPEVRLREADEHPRIVGGPQDLREAEVRPGLAAVVVRVDEVDAEAAHPLHRLAGRLVRRRPRPDLAVVDRHGGEIEPGAVQVEVLTVDPEFAEAEPGRVGDVRRPSPTSGQGHVSSDSLILRRVDVPLFWSSRAVPDRDTPENQLPLT